MPKKPTEPSLDDVRRVMRHLSKKGAAKGGRARAARLTPERRREIAKKAAAARWGSREE